MFLFPKCLFRPSAIFLFYAFLPMAVASPIAKPEESKKTQVQTLLADKSRIVDALIYPATINSKLNAAINAESEGLVKKILVQVGTKVKAGQTLLIYENPDPVYKYSEVRIKAPIGGIVSSIDVSLMSKVEKGQKLLALTDPTQLRVEIEVPASDLALFKLGMRGEFRSQIQDNSFIQVELKGLAPLVDPLTGTARGDLEVLSKKEAGHLSPGLVGQVKFEANIRENILVPESAILFREGKTWVRIVEAGKVKRLPVELGPRQGRDFEVRKGLAPKSEVVIRASRFLVDGDEVSVERKAAGEESANHAQSL